MQAVTVLNRSTTTQNVAMGAASSAGGLAGILYAVRSAWPDLVPWPVEADAAILAALTTTILPWVSRKIAFIRDRRKAKSSAINMSTRSWLPVILCAALAGAGGCATNGISVAETTPEGGTLHVRQHTTSTWGAKTDQGAGDFVYTGTAADGSGFDMRAGSAVQGQQSGDPAALVLGVVNAIAPLVAQAQAAQPVQDDRLDQIMMLLERLIMTAPTR